MLSRLKHKVIGLNRTVGIKVHLLDRGKFLFDLCLVEKKGNLISTINKKLNLSLEEIESTLDASVPVVLIVDGKGILHKTIPIQQGLEKSDILNKLIPNANPSDFYLQTYTSNNQIFSSIIRKNQMSEITTLIGRKYCVYGVFLGPIIISTILPLIDQVQDEITLNHYRISVIDGGIVEISPVASKDSEQKIYNIGDESIDQSILEAYAGALSPFLSNRIDIDHIEGVVREDWEYKILYKKSGIVFLVFFFIVLIVNGYFYLTFGEKNNELQYQYTFHSKNIRKLTDLKFEFGEKHSFVRNVGTFGNFPFAFYADRLANTVPNKISLTVLDLNPLDELVLKRDKREAFQQNIIHIEGSCSGPLLLNEWLETLESLRWIDEVMNQEYIYDNRDKTGRFKFDLKINGNIE